MVEKTAAQSDRIEEMYKEQTKYERNRRTEQDLELSQRESRILELRFAVRCSFALVVVFLLGV